LVISDYNVEVNALFKDSLNRWITVGLFKETSGPNKDFVLMTIDEAREKFVECDDMTGYVFANRYLGGYAHWKAILSSPAMAEYIEEWMEELETKKRAEALQRIESEARTGHFQANKFLADRGWETRAAGRPSNVEVEKNIRREKKLAAKVEHFLTPVKE
jgi:hypothetical protein